MIVSRFLVEPTTPTLSSVGSRPGRFASGLPKASRSPFARLKFWTVNPLRLNAYQVTEVPSLTPRLRWDQLRFWSMLLDEDDEGIARMAGHDPDEYIPTPDEWFGRVKV